MIPTDTTETSGTVERIWFKSYPQGIPADVDVQAYSSVVDVLQQSVQHYRDRPAFANMGTTMSYGELDKMTRDFSAFLQQELGLQKGERLAIMMPNLLQYPVAIFAALRSGLIVTNINPLYTPRELEHQLQDSGASTIILLENFCHVLQQVLPATKIKTIITTRIGDLLHFPKSVLVNMVVKHIKRMVPPYKLPKQVRFKHALQIGERQEHKDMTIGHDDIAFLQYTAGTTGVAKGVLLSHGNIVANLQQAGAWIKPFIEEGKEIVVTPLPLYHIFSLTANCLMFMKIGGLIYLITNPRDLKGFVRELKRLHFTAITGVNTLYKALLQTPGFAELDFSYLKIPLGGGMAIQRAVAQHWQEVTGTTLIEAYGLTETSPGVCINPLDLKEFNGTIGLPLPSTECSIQDEAGRLLPYGEAGEICVRGPQVMHAYWNLPEQTAKVLSADGWFHTGDIGQMDEAGFIKILERKDDMILVSGFNVYPSEIENIVLEHPGVKEVAAVGVADDKSGEVVKIVVVKDNPRLSKEELKEYCRSRMTAYKVPKYIEFRESLPKSPIGKILRRVLH